MELLEALKTRTSAIALGPPGPDKEALQSMLEAAVAAPDHGRMRPWRFLVVSGTGRNRLGEVFAESLKNRHPDATAAALESERAKALRAPLVIVVYAKVIENPKVPSVEQVIAAGAAVQNLMLAAQGLGFAAMWRTGQAAYDPLVKERLGMQQSDAIVGFIYVGTPSRLPPKRPAADLSIAVEWP